MSANGESLKSNLETDKEKLVDAEKVRELNRNSDNLKDSTKNGLQQNGSEQNGSAKNREGDLSTESIIEAFFCTVDKQRRELQIIEKNLSETIQKLETSLRGNLDTFENVNKTLREQIEQGSILLREIKITLSDRESREKSMRLQLAKFREGTSLKDSEGGEDGVNNNLATTEPGSFTSQTITDSDLDETSDEDHRGKSQMELDFVKTILKAAKIRQKMAETEDSDQKEESD